MVQSISRCSDCMSNVGAAIVTVAMMFASLVPAMPKAMAAEPAKGGPAKVEAVAGSRVKRVTLTEKAAQRLDIQIGEIRQDSSGNRIAPSTSVLYDLAGDCWVYINPAPLIYMRQSVMLDRMTGHDVYLKEGPAIGTQVVVVGVAELYGTEIGVGK
jgi:hypothetical protein